ncbi:LysM peptidoglycan-binding domain-containing protein [Tessaracoccus rhinocerotis]|uniref:LysM peptidoglycan-binding domain-containing protein n=1 Tax=Tessaracoccus rhinocerotis TaxID=1689449 RepID=A0A553JWU1_9ACTN|nr:LysM peptidoglycan-binding domain-containing protein [Tessaracoccus rhinocerotis]TRY16912.1 LysM peptidoglycan-binding domain-containing protein [Tessaracoccus rhinocerotis]
MRLLKALAALLLLVVLLVGVPWALLEWGQVAGLAQVQWSTALLRPDDGRITLGLLSLVGWVAWVVVAATTVLESVRAVSRGLVDIRLPGTGWLRPVVASLVAAVAAPLLGSALAGTHPDLAPPPAAAVAPLEERREEIPPSAATDDVESPKSQYVVQPGDELWSVSERVLGSGERWREVVAANPGLSHDAHLRPGQVLNLPEVSEPSASAGADPNSHVTVAEGDTLWDLADEHLGDAERWPELHGANRGLVQDPDEIQVGWELLVPDVVPGGPGEPGDEPARPEPSPPVLETVPPVAERPTTPSEPTPTTTPAPAPTTVEPSASAPASTEPPPPADDVHEPLEVDEAAQHDVLGPLGAVLAAGIFAGVAARRRTQLLQRAVGRRVLPLRPELLRFWSSLTKRSGAAEPPAGMAPTGVVLGWRGGEDVASELEANRCTLAHGSEEDSLAAVSAMLTSLMCAPWSTAVDVVTVQSPDDWEASLDDPRITGVSDLEHGLVQLQKLCASRRIEMGSSSLGELRTDADLASAWAPIVFLFCRPVPESALRRIEDCLSLGEVGVSVVAAVDHAPAPAPGWKLVRLDSPEQALLLPEESRFIPQLLSAPARHAVVELFAGANDETTEPAPWWDEDPLPPNVKVLPRKTLEPTEDTAMPARTVDTAHPTLLLLGPVELRGCTGPAPSRSRAASTECCAWLLANPGSTPTRMARELVVAESTRRSMVSRLRTWLGNDLSGSPYLPDAYSGRLELHPDVESDWERFQVLLSGGVNHASTPILREALDLVRGEPLEGVAFQWPWAEQLRTDMVSMITDAAVVLFDRALEQGDAEAAGWAVSRGRLAAGQDETLAVRDIQLLALAGDRAQVDQAVRRLTRATRAAGRDLTSDSVRRIQRSLHLVVAGQEAN